MTSLVRVRRKTPCPVCNKPDWCSTSPDGGMVICMRVSDGATREAVNGGYVHVLERREYQPNYSVQRKPEPAPVASLERRDAVYRALLGALPLTARHSADLRRRGLSSLTIELNSYASLPASPALCGQLAEVHNLSDVPGFYRDDSGRWALAVNGSGFLVPVRDTRGRIQGCQIRQDFGGRYVWLSSGEKGGASSGAPIHIARPWRAEVTGECIITEGPLKADVAAELLDVCVVGVPGVSAFGVHFGAELMARLPKLSAVFVAYDADWKTNKAVSAALWRLFDSLEAAGLKAEMLQWIGAKGFDDFLIQEGVK